MNNIIKNRTEFLFIYENELNNPNGDPANENKPRFDYEDNRIIVSDVRIKRTVRDYWTNYKGYDGTNGKDVFTRETPSAKKGIKDGKERAKDFKDNADVVIEQCIDVRVFGGVLPVKDNSQSITGAVQIQHGKSLHEAEFVMEKGTGAFASGEKGTTQTFRTEYRVPYALVATSGIVNENAAKHTKMTEADRDLLWEGLWDGTKNVITRSKIGQSPVLLLKINYNKPFHIGNIRNRIKIQSEKIDVKLRSLEDFSLDVTLLFSEIKKYKEHIESVAVQFDSRLKLTYNEQDFELSENIDVDAL